MICRCLGMLVLMRSLQRTELIRFATDQPFPCIVIDLVFNRPSKSELFCYFCLQFNKVLQRELNAIEKDKDEFIHDFSEVSLPSFV
jgi:hypothetical protein